MTTGFILVRHVNSEDTNQYWIESLRAIKRLYPESPIMIIDDNSRQDLISENIDMTNVTVIQSEFPQRGELLPYYYFYTMKPFEKAIIIHDSVFFQQRVDFGCVTDVSLLWTFTHEWDNIAEEMRILQTLKNYETLEAIYTSTDKWKGCFGVMSFITHAFLSKLVATYDIFRLLETIHSRDKRMCLERIFAVMCYSLTEVDTVFGDIHIYTDWRYFRFDQFKRGELAHLPVVKVWTGR